MEPGTLELQIFVSLIVILGTAFVALVCDYLKGNNESLREHNIELRVRKEEQDKHQPLEAVQWLQHLLGATQRNPIRFGSMRPAPRREHHPAAARHSTTVPSQPAAAKPAAAPVVKMPEVPVQAPPAATPRPVEPAAITKTAEVAEVAVEQRASRLQAGRARRQASGVNPPSLLDTLPKPAWLQKEQEEKAVARSLRQEQQAKEQQAKAAESQPPVPEATPVAKVVAEEPVVAVNTETKRTDPFWTYRGLLDRVVAATSGPDRVEEPAPVIAAPVAEPEPEQAIPMPAAVEQPQVLEQVQLVETASTAPVVHSAPIETITTVTIDVPASPEHETVPVVEDEPLHNFTWNSTARPVVPVEPAPFMETVETASVFDSIETPVAETHEPEPIVAETIEIQTAEPKQMPQLVSMPSVPELRLPPGYHDRTVFTRHLHSHDVLTGVVAAIGINDYTHHNEKMGIGPMADLMRSVENMVAGMLRPGVDFGCRSNDDEFILVFPNETGADAQRRLTTISERLWNFQLRSLTSFSVFFSWGAVEVQGETLADAAASASERMYQTKRNRKTLSVDAQRRKLAVNL